MPFSLKIQQHQSQATSINVVIEWLKQYGMKYKGRIQCIIIYSTRSNTILYLPTKKLFSIPLMVMHLHKHFLTLLKFESLLSLTFYIKLLTKYEPARNHVNFAFLKSR